MSSTHPVAFIRNISDNTPVPNYFTSLKSACSLKKTVCSLKKNCVSLESVFFLKSEKNEETRESRFVYKQFLEFT